LFIFGAFFNEWARSLLGKQWSGAARILKEHKLITSGPYSVVRHPMYFANILMYIGCLIIIRSYILFGLFLILIAILSYRIKIEEKELFNKFGKEYEEYKKKVALIIPYIFKTRASHRVSATL
jgi:protein-S-isoprenylcysteine O-methyltransferase